MFPALKASIKEKHAIYGGQFKDAFTLSENQWRI